jgi:hypothetical protein
MQATLEMPLFATIPVSEFDKYDNDNPHIWRAFERIALNLISNGRDHYSAKAIFEVIRYETAIRGNDEFKLNNDFTSGYARKFIAKYPQYKNFFELRERKAN